MSLREYLRELGGSKPIMDKCLDCGTTDNVGKPDRHGETYCVQCE